MPIFFEKEKPHFLLVKHAKGHWSFPKGHKNANETDKETALRELKEEICIESIKLQDTEPIIEEYNFVSDGETIHKQVSYFLGIVHSKTATPDLKEILEIKWCDFDEALKQMTYESSKRTLYKAKTSIETVN